MAKAKVASAAVAPVASSPPSDAWLMGGLAVAVAVAAAIRLTWNADMEFKGDEYWMFLRAMHVGRDEPWPDVGMPSGVGLKNPGFSVWAFALLARLFGAATPLQLDRAVVLTNVIAFAALAAFVWRCIPRDMREVWVWGIGLAAVNPIAVLLERKIWAQSLFPLFSVAFLWGWWLRDRRVGAAVWGCVGALLGQLHMSGFFFAGAFFLSTLLASRRDDSKRTPTRWGAWVVGSVLGSLTMLPWLRYVLSGQDQSPPWSWAEVRSLGFFRWGLMDTVGLGLDFNLGPHFSNFLGYPGNPPGQYPVLYLHMISVGAGAAIFLFALVALWRRWSGWRQLARWPGQTSETAFAAFAGLLVFGAMLTLLGAKVFRHYLHVTFPLEMVAVALLAFRYTPRPRRWLGALCLSQLCLSLALLSFIHANGGALGGDYGRAYRGR